MEGVSRQFAGIAGAIHFFPVLKNDVSRKQTEFADAPDQVKANLRIFGRVLHDD
ncbi:hypothetical protein D3C72_2532620 [compost metagenome]